MMNPGEERVERPGLLVAEFEAAPSSGVFRVDERLRVEEVIVGCDDRVSEARVAVRLDDQFDAVSARARYLPDCRVLIRTNEPDPTTRSMLFEGYPPLLEAEWDGRPGRSQNRCTFAAEHVYGRMARERRCWIYGRRMRSGEIEDGLASSPEEWQSASVLVSALPCVFNLDGVANCAPTPLTVTGPGGAPRELHIFTSDNDPQAQPWTYLNALRYLCWFHQLSEGLVYEGNVFTETDAAVHLPPDCPAEVLPDGALLRRLLAAPDDLSVEATNLVEALALLAAECGVHLTAETVNVLGKHQSRLRVWADEDGPLRELPLAPGGRHADGTVRFDASAMSAAEVYRANTIERARIGWDHRRVVNAPVVIGAVKQHEMTVPLVPGWEPESQLDNVPPNEREAAKALAWTPDEVAGAGEGVEDYPWYQRYHKKGVDFAQYQNVARLWVLNEDGRFGGAIYNRNAPFDDYQPFDFSTVANAATTGQGTWTRRPRRLRDTITLAEDGSGFGVFVQVSFDSGSSWHEPSGARVRFDPTGIYFDVTNPTSITPSDTYPEEQNLWYAIIEQTFRVRVTALIDSDQRLVARHTPDESKTPTLWTTSRVVFAPTRYSYESRTGTVDVLSEVNPDSSTIEVDESAEAQSYVRNIASNEQDGQVSLEVTVPWLETVMSIGDRVSGITGRGLNVRSRVDRAAAAPAIRGLHYRLSGGRWDTELIVGTTEIPT
ncbi:MAG: hypothetical protein GY842_08655 [bacterium]|nr:hypothetical protein [bacterium]